MAKVIALNLFILIASVVAEPPVGYLPPQAHRSSPLGVYGAPFGGTAGKASSSFSSRSGSSSISYSALHDPQVPGGVHSSAAFGASGSLSRQYGVPFGSAGNAAFTSGNEVSQMFLGPNVGGLHLGSSSGSNSGFGGFQQYTVPSASSAGTAGSALKSGFGNFAGVAGPSSSFSLSQQYGAPNAGSIAGFGTSAGAFGNNKLNSFSGSSFNSPARSSIGITGSGNGFQALQQYKAPAAVSTGATGFGTSSGSLLNAARANSAGLSHSFQVSPQYQAPVVGSSPVPLHSGPAVTSGAFLGSSAGSAGLAQRTSLNSFASSNGFGISQRYDARTGGRFSAPAPVYGAPNAAAYSLEEDVSEPANYEYTYEVQAADVSGVQFGHQESREDEAAKGAYHVLLPDGRTQVVEYQANEGGYQPKIRYEEPASLRAHSGGSSGPY